MTDDEIDIRLVGFEGFKASQRSLGMMYEEIWVARWGLPPRPRVHWPTNLTTAEMMQSELALPCKVVVISSHVGYDEEEPDRMCFFSNNHPKPILHVDEIKEIGATSMVLIDGCSAESLFPHLRSQTKPGVRLVGVKGGVRKWTQGRDSVLVIADVMRELCYTTSCDLSPEAVDQAVERVNAKIDARNEHLIGKEAQMPCLAVHKR